MLWDLNEGKHLYTLSGNAIINAMAFSPNRYWLCAAVGSVVKIWDLEDKKEIEELKPDIASGEWEWMTLFKPVEEWVLRGELLDSLSKISDLLLIWKL